MTTYVPGPYATLVTDDGVVMAPADRLNDVAALGERGLDALTVVEVLSRGALSDLPEFVAVQCEGSSVRILVRGGFEVRVDGVIVDGAGAPTWNESAVPVVAGTIVAIAAVGAAPSGAGLPLNGGVVHSAGVRWTPVISDAAATAPGSAAPTSSAPGEFTVVRAAAPIAAPITTPPAPPAPPAPPPPLPPPAPQAPPADLSTDHDGHTMTAAQLQALREGQAPSAPPGTPPPAPPARPLVALRFSTGRVVPVRRRVLIGRSPRVQQVGGSANLPALVTVEDPYVSGTHLEVSTDGTRITATDTSTNGTLLARRGRAPIPLDPGVATEITIGDVLTLSKGLTATVIQAPVEA